MSKLIGTNPNQVPSNADLGTAAFMDKKEFLLSKGSEMSAINTVISKTALDVFVYDTTKDSDGGAWRKRTQHTSWYNEKLNTTTRGARKEFPAVAVIVMEYASVKGKSAMTIYDGDNPTLPMWMSCQVDTNTRWIRYNGTIRSVAALNGVILAGANGADIADSLLSRMDLICDKLERHFDGGVHQIDNRGIVHRNDNFKITSNASQNIINRYVNDVAMTVQPNAPIDAATGLPTPTVAIATQAGVTVIQNNGSVRNLSGAVYVSISAFGEYFVAKGSGDDLSVMRWDSTDTVINYTKGTYRFNGNPATGYHPFLYGNGGKILAVDHTKRIHHLTGVTGLTTWDIDGGVSDRNSLQNSIKTNFNTGWMHGDIKLATLSDTDDTNVTGSELVTNGDFSNGTTGWSQSGSTQGTWAVTSGVLQGTGATGFSNYLSAPITCVVGKTYTFSLDITAIGGADTYIGIGDTPSGRARGDAYVHEDVVGTYSSTFIATQTTHYVVIQTKAGNSDSVDNFSVRLAEPDRSVNNNGLQVFGAITKTAVATGADLVAYSGFANSNYFKSEGTGATQFGTGDFSVSTWIKTSDTYGVILDVRAINSSQGFYFETYTDHQFRLSGMGATVQSSSNSWQDGVWTHVVFTRVSGFIYIYINGVLDGSGANNSNVTDDYFRVGIRRDNAETQQGSLALLRISATAPTAEQIAKIYRDEKPLFQEGAQATLYGTSDAVTALAYDDDTGLLHAGTSAGRSVFKGLQRVSNTTDAVGVAISASNDLVVEE